MSLEVINWEDKLWKMGLNGLLIKLNNKILFFLIVDMSSMIMDKFNKSTTKRKMKLSLFQSTYKIKFK
jgi:hypothetical protein